MKIEVKEIKEQEEGSAILTIDYDEEGKQVLLEEGMMSIIRKYLDKRDSKPDVYFIEYFYLDGEGEWSCTNMVEGNLKLTFDGETGKLKSAEVLNGS